MGDPIFLSDLLNYKVRQLDLEYIHRLGELHFVKEGKNVIIWGAPGTGKTWLGQAIATKACEEGIWRLFLNPLTQYLSAGVSQCPYGSGNAFAMRKIMIYRSLHILMNLLESPNVPQ